MNVIAFGSPLAILLCRMKTMRQRHSQWHRLINTFVVWQQTTLTERYYSGSFWFVWNKSIKRVHTSRPYKSYDVLHSTPLNVNPKVVWRSYLTYFSYERTSWDNVFINTAKKVSVGVKRRKFDKIEKLARDISFP